MEGFDGKRYLVTGASSGLGRAVCLALAARGAAVILTGRNEERLNATLRDMEPGDHSIMPCDLGDPDGIDPWLKNILDTHGSVDGLAYCAGIGLELRLKQMTPSTIQHLMQINFVSFLACVRALALGKPRDKPMRVVAISSAATLTSRKYFGLYAASKAAMEAAIRSLATELVSRNVGICSTRLGYIATPMIHVLDELMGDVDMSLKKLGYQPMGLIPPEAAAETVVFLLSDKARYITGPVYPSTAGRSSAESRHRKTCSMRMKVSMNEGYAFITGASSGMGAATAKLLAGSCPLILHGRDEQRLGAVAEACRQQGSEVLLFPYDFTDVTNLARDVQAFLKSAGNPPVATFAHFAGMTDILPMCQVNYALGCRIFNVNYFAATELIATLLKKRHNAKSLRAVLLISSIVAYTGIKYQPHYSGSKSAIEGLVKSLAIELAPNVRVNCIAPGSFNTRIMHTTFRNITNQTWTPPTLLPPMGVDEIAKAARFLLSDESAYITGQVLHVDGGQRLLGIKQEKVF